MRIGAPHAAPAAASRAAPDDQGQAQAGNGRSDGQQEVTREGRADENKGKAEGAVKDVKHAVEDVKHAIKDVAK